jgi:GLPGLI family protein
MKTIRIVLAAFILLTCNFIFAQETIVLNVVYEFKYVRDLENKDMPYISNMVLSLGKQSSRYCTEKLYNENDKNAQLQKQQQAQAVSAKPMAVAAGGPLLIVGKYGAIINEEVIKDLVKQKLITNSHLGIKTYSIESDLPKINWAIQDEKKTVGKYPCQKAVGTYGGRTYTAWFAPDLPFRDGPWKLSGLPGLILEAQDTKNEVFFSFRELSKNSDAEETTKSFLGSDYNIKTNLKGYNRAKAAFETDPESVMSAQAPNAKLVVMNIDDPKTQRATRVKKYNPLEYD